MIAESSRLGESSAHHDVVTVDDAAKDDESLEFVQPKWRYLLLACVVLLLVAIFKMVKHAPHQNQVLKDYIFEVSMLFFTEASVALAVAFFVGYYIEAQAKKQDAIFRKRERDFSRSIALEEQSRAEKRRELIARDVIEGVFGLKHEPKYVRSVVAGNLESNVVRQDVSLDYSLAELDAEQREKIAVSDPGRFVILTMISAYQFRNLSSEERAVDVRYSLAVRHGAGARGLAGVVGLKVGDSDIVQEDIENGLIATGNADEKEYRWPQRIPAGGTLSVNITVITVKERSDNEVWGSFFPTVSGLKARFSVLEGKGMVFGIRPLLASPLREVQRQGHFGTWQSDGPVLPNNSAVFWWRTPEDDAR